MVGRNARNALIALAALAALAAPGNAAPRTRLFLGAGGTGTSDFGFRGGWGMSGGVEVSVAPHASFLVRGDYHLVPDGAIPGAGVVYIATPTALGEGPGGDLRATLIAGMMGLRLHGPTGPGEAYMDALVGVGHHHDRLLDAPAPALTSGHEIRQDTNAAVSFGLGYRLSSARRGALFADAHYDFYFVEGASTPLIPVRIGLMYP